MAATETPEDVETNVKFIIRNSIAATADATGLRAGAASEKLVDRIWADLVDLENIHWRKELGRLPAPKAQGA